MTDADPARRREAELEAEIERLLGTVARQRRLLEDAGIADAPPKGEGGLVRAFERAPASKREAQWRHIFERMHEGFFVGEVVRDAEGVARDWRFVEMNPAWERLSGLSRDDCAGRAVSEVIPELEPEWIVDYVAVAETGVPASFTRPVGALGLTYQVNAFQVDDDRFGVLFYEVSARERAERRRAALLELADRLRDTRDPAEASFAAGEILGRTLGVSRAGYGTIDPVREVFSVERDWNAPGIATLAGSLRFRDFGSYIEDLKRGETVAIADAALDFRTAATATGLAAISARSFVNMPVLEAGGFVALAYVNQAEPRSWTDEDLSFMREVAERTRSAVERRRAEDGLRHLAASLERQVAERTLERDGVWRVSRDMLGMAERNGVWRSVNPAWTRILGWDVDDFIGRTSAWMLHPDDREGAQARRDALAAGRPVTFEGRYRTRTGGYRLLSWTSVPSEGRIYGVARDVTEERAREAALRDSRDFARLALASVGGIGVWTYDVSADLFRCDAAIADLYGVDPVQAAAGIPPAGFLANVHPGDRARLDATMATGREREGDLELEYRIAHPGGSTRWVMSRGHTYFGDDGRPVRRTGVGVETTKQREMAEQLRQAQKMEAVGQLTGGVAHDFNNLLTVIKSSTDLLKRPDLPEPRRLRYVAAISDTVDRAAKLTSQLLAFARRQTLQPEVFDVGQSVHQLADMMNALTGSRIDIATRMPDAPCFIDADPSQFDTAVVNMAVNARDAMDGQGRLTVVVRRTGERPATRTDPAVRGAFVAVSLTDTGSGIPADALERIFEPFFTTKDVGKGTGLGLSQVYGFAKQSGGEVTVESAVGAGSTFTLYLPEVGAPKDAVAADEPEPLVDGHGTRVLVVEDNQDVGTFATQTLAELGYATTWARDGERALVELARGPDRFDIVFSDVIMPGMNGIELAREIRRRHPTLPVVLTSGYSHVLAENGTFGFELLHKPYSVEQLSRILRRAAAGRPRRRVTLG